MSVVTRHRTCNALQKFVEKTTQSEVTLRYWLELSHAEWQGELEETTRTSSNYVDEDYTARREIKQSLTGWGDNCGSESSTLETDVCVWHYAPLVVHATQDEEEAG